MRTLVGIFLMIALALLIIFLIITGKDTIQAKKGLILTDKPLEPKRILIDITTEPADTVYVYDVSDY